MVVSKKNDWSLINNDGILLFRTSMGANPKAFFQDATDGKGDRDWIDFYNLNLS